MSKKVDDLELARKLLDRYGGQVDDFFKLWPEDKTYFFSSDNKSFIAYAVRYRAAICIGDPVGSDHSILSLLREFSEFCRKNKWTIAFIQGSDKYRVEYQSIGLRSLLIGADAVVNLNTFKDVTLRNKYFRNLVNRINKQGFYLDVYKPPHSERLIKELSVVSSSWVGLPHKKEWSFLTGRFDKDYLKHVDICVLRDRKGTVQAFANELPPYKRGVASIDMMRHNANAPTNSIDMLFAQLFVLKLKDGYHDFNLGISPLDGKPFIKNMPDKLLFRLYKSSNSFIGFDGLHHFKAKYRPVWEARYVWHEKGANKLLRDGIAILRLLRG